MRRQTQIVLSLFGDGAANEGIFHESLNMAALWDLPVLFLCENNQYAMSMQVSRSTAKLPIASRAEIYGIPGYHVDGNDVLLVYETIYQAAEHVRRGDGPVLVEAETYRYFGHSKSDRNLYRTKDEIAQWRKRDSIARFRSRLVGGNILTEKEAEEIDRAAQGAIEDAVAFAEASPEPDPSTLTEYVYA
jgi:TPP-dependent pyruvate/acetoin dehydrogenase alpha subunit